ncbi:MAG: enoyl-CoA hydratase-related protein [Acidobacteriota bacterium]|jgi:enoyl-CoA hydratase|nr:enoyl-CoA hydratase-related protein [Acidobacteriota bacterium]
MDNTGNIKIIDLDLNREISEDLNQITNDENIRVVILGFTDEFDFIKENDFEESLIEQIKHFPIPVICKIKNQAKDFLFEIVLASHICIATESAEFEIADGKKLKKQIGAKNLEKLNSIENRINAKTALDLGIINKITTAENLEKKSFEMAEQISKLAPIAIGYCLKAVNQGSEINMKDGLKLETELFSRIFATEDMKEGTSAFLEKREPKFNGK